MFAGGGPRATGSKRFFVEQSMLKEHAGAEVDKIEESVPLDTTVEAVFVTVTLVNSVVWLSTVAVVSITVGIAEDMITAVPFDVYVVCATVMEVIDTIVGTGRLAIVELPTTVEYVLTGSVTVAVIESGGAVVEPLRCETVMLVGCNVADVMLGMLVGNGCIGGMPSVASVVIIEPVVLALVGMPLVGD